MCVFVVFVIGQVMLHACLYTLLYKFKSSLWRVHLYYTQTNRTANSKQFLIMLSLQVSFNLKMSVTGTRQLLACMAENREGGVVAVEEHRRGLTY